MSPNQQTLRDAEDFLRRDDKAIRLRVSAEDSSWVLVERKVQRGRIGRCRPGGESYPPDLGIQAEQGTILACRVPAESFDPVALRWALQQADTWRQRPLADRVDEADRTQRRHRRGQRVDTARYLARDVYNRYVWKVKSRVAVPGAIA